MRRRVRCWVRLHRYEEPQLVLIGDSMYVECSDCGALSRGVRMNTTHVRATWGLARMRAQLKRKSAQRTRSR
jgi:hypothetical protein